MGYKYFIPHFRQDVATCVVRPSGSVVITGTLRNVKAGDRVDCLVRLGFLVFLGKVYFVRRKGPLVDYEDWKKAVENNLL